LDPGGGASLVEATMPELLFPALAARDAPEVLRELAAGIAGALPGLSAEELRSSFAEREALGSTALGDGLAVPHCKVARIARAYLAVGLSAAGVGFGAADGRPVHAFFAVISPSQAPGTHLKLLAAISRWARIPGRLEALRGVGGRAELLECLAEGAP